MKKFLCVMYLVASVLFMSSFQSVSNQIEDTVFSDNPDRIESVKGNVYATDVADEASVVLESGLDSLQVRQIVDVAFNAGVMINGNRELLPGVPNPLLHMLSGALIGFVFHLFHKRRLRKKNGREAEDGYISTHL